MKKVVFVCLAAVCLMALGAGTGHPPLSLATSAYAQTSGASYVLTAWGELGMHCMDGKDYSVFAVLPPYNTIYAKLLTKGGEPVPVTSGVTVTYQAYKDSSGSINTTSAGTSKIPAKTNFWNFVYTLFHGQPPADTGLAGNKVQSLTPQPMTFDSTLGLWKADGIPTSPIDDSGKTNAYPMAKVVAKDSSGRIIAQATVVLAVSDEMSCRTCHASGSNAAAKPAAGWVYNSDPAKDVKLNILKLHDDLNVISPTMLGKIATRGYNYKSSLYATASSFNNPVLCAVCHKSNALEAAGVTTGVTKDDGTPVPQLTTSMHGIHANVTPPGSTTSLNNATSPTGSCYLCHPGVNTKCQRGAMRNIACYDCHGNLSRLAVTTRQGWLDEPTCQMCHQNGTSYTSTFTSTNRGPSATWRSSTDKRFATTANVPATGYSLYRFSKGHGGMQCSACHGSQHGEYPTNQANDNAYSISLQGYAGKLTECTVCHTTAPLTASGGPHGMHTVGQSWVNSHPSYARANLSQCAYCHGSNYRGTVLSKLLTTKTFKVDDGRTATFAAGTQLGCYSCHNGPNG